MVRSALWAVVVLWMAVCGTVRTLAQEPVVVHALRAETTGAGLRAQIAAMRGAGAPGWVGYQLAVERPFQVSVAPGSTVYLEGGGPGERYDRRYSRSVDRVMVLLRFGGDGLERVRVEGPDRQVDGGGLRFAWVPGVRGEESVQVMEGVARETRGEEARDGAVLLVALARSDEATPALLRLARAAGQPGLQEKAAFWLASSRGHEGFVALEELLRDADVRGPGGAGLREKLTFDLSLCPEEGAVEDLIGLAQRDPAPEVRSKAQFWMATLASKRVGEELRTETESDGDARVRESAVFALSQLPGEQAATELIRVAETSKDAGVRRRAVFWLGQSRDPRALAYLERVVRSGSGS